MTVNGAVASHVKITGGAGNLTVFNLIGTGSSVNGSTSGFTFVDDNYGGSGNTIGGGAGNGPGKDPGTGTFAQGTEIIGGKGDVILGGSGTMLVNLEKPGVTGVSVSGGSGAATIWGGAGDTITGGSGALQFNGIGGSSVTGGAGVLNAFNLGTGNTITGGSSGTDFIDDSYAGGGNNRLIGGTAATRIIGGSGDTISGGAGALSAEIKTGFGSETVNLATVPSGSADVVRDVSVGGAGTKSTVTGFSTSNDSIASATSVNPGGGTGPSALGVGATATASGSDTLITFADSSTMLVVGVAPGAIKFIQ
jgi:hypothetical protein